MNLTSLLKKMDAPDANFNDDAPGGNAGVGGNTIWGGAMGAANNAAVMDPARALAARRWNELIGACHSFGIMSLVTTDKFITEQGLDLVQ